MKAFIFESFEEQINIIPTIALYIHNHAWDFDKDIRLWHLHISIQWIKWYFELRIGRDE